MRVGASIEIDKNTSVGRANKYISDRSFFSLFTDAEILAIDQSSYENADLIGNLCEPLPSYIPRDFTLVYNGSVLDNVFDPATAMCNISELTAPGGTIFHYEGVAHWLGAYIKFMPDWFFDYYAVNNFKSCYALLCHYKNIHNSPWEISEWWPFESEGDSFKLASVPPAPDGHDCVVVIVAEKGPESTSGKFPVQGPYRLDHSEYIEAYKRFKSHSVPFRIEKVDSSELHFITGPANVGKTTKAQGWTKKLKRKIKNLRGG